MAAMDKINDFRVKKVRMLDNVWDSISDNEIMYIDGGEEKTATIDWEFSRYMPLHLKGKFVQCFWVYADGKYMIFSDQKRASYVPPTGPSSFDDVHCVEDGDDE